MCLNFFILQERKILGFREGDLFEVFCWVRGGGFEQVFEFFGFWGTVFFRYWGYRSGRFSRVGVGVEVLYFVFSLFFFFVCRPSFFRYVLELMRGRVGVRDCVGRVRVSRLRLVFFSLFFLGWVGVFFVYRLIVWVFRGRRVFEEDYVLRWGGDKYWECCFFFVYIFVR